MVRLALIAVGIAASTILFFILTLLCSPRLPQAAMIMHLELNSTARRIDAGYYAVPLIQQAGQEWEQAQHLLKTQNQRLSLFRSYAQVEKLIMKANQDLRRAILRTKVIKDSLKLALNLKLNYLQNQAEQYRIKYDLVPIAIELRQHIIQGELLLRQSGYLMQRSDYPAAALVLENAASHISYANANIEKEINRYLSEIPVWQKWVEETIAYAQNSGDIVIIIDKLDHSCRIFQADSLLFDFAIDLGPNWIGAKMQKGDRRTPEGKYFVTKKRQGKETIFYKAFNLNYPNDTDWQRFYSALYNGEIPLTANIGGLIEIHGDGGTGINWTEGCIALSNEDIDKIFPLIQVGTPVTIVGTIKSYQFNFNHSNHGLD
jgi:murein L,D-transpeptidase YafK